MSSSARLSNRPAPASFPSTEAVAKARVMVIGETIRALLKDLGPEDREALKRNIADALAEKPAAPRAGPVLDKVIHLIHRERERRSEWKVDELKKALVNEGVSTSPRALYNALGYLARKRRIKQIGYGRYYVLDYGFSIEAVAT